MIILTKPGSLQAQPGFYQLQDMGIAVSNIHIVDGIDGVKPTGLNCLECGVFFRVKRSHLDKRKYCSRSCRAKSDSRRQSGVLPKGFHKKEKPGPHTRVEPAKICGHITKKGRSYCPRCRVENFSELKEKPCVVCGSIMVLSKSQYNKYKCCSMECRNISISVRQKGELSHLWRGGISDENRRLRNSAEYDKWRRLVMARDNYTCTICGQIGGKLCADHIKEWSLYPALRFDVDNGRTLCWPCHAKTENFGYKAYSKIKSLEVDGCLQYLLF